MDINEQAEIIKNIKSVGELRFKNLPTANILNFLPISLLDDYIALLQSTNKLSVRQFSSLLYVIFYRFVDDSVRAITIIDAIGKHYHRQCFCLDSVGERYLKFILSRELDEKHKLLLNRCFELLLLDKDKYLDIAIDTKATNGSLLTWLIYEQKAFPVKKSNEKWYFNLRGTTPKQTLDFLQPSEVDIASRILKCYFKNSKAKNNTPVNYLPKAPEWLRPYVLQVIAEES